MKTRRPVFLLWFLTIFVLSLFLNQTVSATDQSITSAPSSISLPSLSQSSTSDSSSVPDLITATSSTILSELSVTATATASVTFTDILSTLITSADFITTLTPSLSPSSSSTISDSFSPSITSRTSTDGKSSSVTDTQASETSTRGISKTDLALSSASLSNRLSTSVFITSTSDSAPLPTRTGTLNVPATTGSGGLNGHLTGSSQSTVIGTQSRVLNNVDVVAQSTSLTLSDGGSQVLVLLPSGSGGGLGSTSVGNVGVTGSSNLSQTGITAGDKGAGDIPTGVQEKIGSRSRTDLTTGRSSSSSISRTIDGYLSSTPSVAGTATPPVVPISAAKENGGRTKWIIVAAVFGAVLLVILSLLGLICYRRYQRRIRTVRRATEATPYREVRERDVEQSSFVGRVGVKGRGPGLPVLSYRGGGEIEGHTSHPRPSVSSTVSSTPTLVPSRIRRLVQALHSDSESRSGSGPPSYTNDVPPNYEVEDSLMVHAQ